MVDIDALVAEAGGNKIHDTRGYGSYHNGVQFSQEALANFVELIATDVIDRAERYGLGCDAVEELKEQFGVE